MAQVPGDGLAGIGRQRKNVLPPALAADPHRTGAAVEVCQIQPHDLSTSEAESCHQQQDRVVAQTGFGVSSSAAAQKMLDVSRWDRFRHR